MEFPTIWPQYFTATIQNWKHLLKDDDYKDIIIDCLKFLTADKRIELNAFTIMSNHVHIIWQPLKHYTLTQIQTSFSTQTSREIIKKLKQQNLKKFESLKVNKYDRAYHPDSYRDGNVNHSALNSSQKRLFSKSSNIFIKMQSWQV